MTICPKCGNQTEHLVTNIRDNSEGCWACIAGPDNMMLRMVGVETDSGVEIHLVHAANNKLAMEQFYRPGVIRMRCEPLPN